MKGHWLGALGVAAVLWLAVPSPAAAQTFDPEGPLDTTLITWCFDAGPDAVWPEPALRRRRNDLLLWLLFGGTIAGLGSGHMGPYVPAIVPNDPLPGTDDRGETGGGGSPGNGSGGGGGALPGGEDPAGPTDPMEPGNPSDPGSPPDPSDPGIPSDPWDGGGPTPPDPWVPPGEWPGGPGGGAPVPEATPAATAAAIAVAVTMFFRRRARR